MAQRKETQTNTRVLTKSLGTASILSLAIAGVNTASALEMDISAEYRATAFALDSESYNDDSAFGTDTDDGLGHLLRLKGDVKHESGVSLHTSVELAGDRWTGDNRGGNVSELGAYNNANQGDNVRLDLAYVQVPLNDSGAIVRVGRQAASWNNCFLVCDDRRDRISSLTPTAIGTLIALYDRRGDSARAQNQDDGDMVSAGLVTKLGGFDAGILWVHWLNNYTGGAVQPAISGLEPEVIGETANGDQVFANGGGYAAAYPLQGVHLISPYIDGSIADGAIRLAAGFNWVAEGETESQNNPNPNGPTPGDASLKEDGQFFDDNAWSQYLRVGTDAGPVAVDFQYVGSQDGGLISSGFDTYSSIINSNPESTANSTSIYTMGNGSGLKDDDETLLIARASFDVNPQLKLSASIGNLDIDNGTNDDDSMVYDVMASYQVNEAVRTWISVGMLEENEAGRLTANGLGGAASQSDGFEDVIASSLNMSVMF